MKKQPLLAKELLEGFISEGKFSRDISIQTGINDRTVRWYFKKYRLQVPMGKSHTAWNKGMTADDPRIKKAADAAHAANKGKKAWNNKGGWVNEYGYRIIYVNGKRKREHVHIMGQAIGRRLKPNEVVHHKDEDKLNNNVENLQLMTKTEHAKQHYPKGSKFGVHKRKN